MDWRKNRNHFTNYCLRWRISNLGKTKPNHRYFMGKINSKIVRELRKQYFSIFNSVSELSYGIKIKNDSD